MLGAAHLPPRDHAPVLRPRERNVEEPHRFGEFLEPFDGHGPLVRVEVEDIPVIVRFAQVIHRVHRLGATRRTARVPGERAEHHGEFESLGPVHGQDLDELLVALDPELDVFVVAIGLRPAVIQPGGELGRREPFPCFRLLQQLGEMPVVREPARPVPVTEKAFRAGLSFEKLQQDGSDPLRLPVRTPAREPLRPVAPHSFVVAEGQQRSRVEPEQIAGQRPADPGLSPGLGQSPQQALDLLRFARVKHAAVVDLDAAHSAIAECARDHPALRSGADQHRDVRAGQRLTLDRRLAARAELQEAGKLVRSGVRDDGVHVLLRERLASLRAREKP